MLRKPNITVMFLTALFLISPLGSFSTSADVTDDEVREGIRKLVNAIYKARNQHGVWDTVDKQKAEDKGEIVHNSWGGLTSLYTYALLSAGESYQNPKLTKAIEFLADNVGEKMDGTYARAVRAHVWAAMPEQFDKYLQKDIYWLLGAQGAGPNGGGYDYTAQPNPNRMDNSVTQYGALGVWEGAKRGSAVGKGFWRKLEDHFNVTQNDDGGWGYSENRDTSYGSMVAAGIAVLHITQDYLHTQDFKTVGRASEHPLQKRINAGLGWMGKHFRPNKNATSEGQDAGALYYYLYGVERIGLASGYKYFNKSDWYQDGASFILRNIGSLTNATTNGNVRVRSQPAFALLFLVRGRVPVFINKLQVPDYDWNNRPRDVANLTNWVSDEVENKMNWQIISIDSRPSDWLDSPVMYLSGHKELELSDERKANLKKYIDMGGLLITTSDDARRPFTNSVEALMKELYPQYSMETIPHDDDIFNMNFKLERNRWGVQGVHNGIRHLALHFPRDLSWAFHSNNKTDPQLWQLMANIYYYATEKGRTRARLDKHFERKNKTGGGPEVIIARGKHSGNWNPEPMAWDIQTNYMHNRKKASPKIIDVPLAELGDSDASLVHVAGIDPVTFSADEIAGIKAHIAKGGVIVFETAGGIGDFATSAREMLMKAFPEQRIRPINFQSEVITGDGIGGYDVANINYRNYAVLRMGRLRAPRLLMMEFDGKPQIIISSEDLTEAMINQPVWGVFGYSSESAQKIMTNITLYANKLAPAAAAGADDKEMEEKK